MFKTHPYYSLYQNLILFFFSFWQHWSLNQCLHLEPLHQSFLCVYVCVCVCVCRVFQDRILRTILLGWLWTAILLIFGSWVARITGVSHWLKLYPFLRITNIPFNRCTVCVCVCVCVCVVLGMKHKTCKVLCPWAISPVLTFSLPIYK
jgi:hypothetical protein